MTGTDLCVNKPHKSWSYLNHLVNETAHRFYMLLYNMIPWILVRLEAHDALEYSHFLSQLC
jgi:hypothetical protein